MPRASSQQQSSPRLVLAALLALAPSATSATALEPGSDGAPVQSCFELAQARSADSLDALETQVAALRDSDMAHAAYGAFGLFRGTSLEAAAIERLGRRAFVERRPEHARAAVHALVLLGPAAEDELRRVLERHPDPGCRALALRPLLPSLWREADEAACRLVLANADLESGMNPGVAAVLRRCEGRASELAMLRELRQTSSSPAWKLLLIGVLAERDSPAVTAAIERRVRDADRDVRLAALAEMSRRDSRATIETLRGLARAGDEEQVRDAILALATLRDADPEWVLELSVFARSRSVESRRAVVSALSDLRTREAVWLLHRLLEDEDWRVQIEAVRAVASLRQRESVPRLIELLAHGQTRVRDEAHQALRLLTAIDQGTTRARWAAWFAGEGATFVVPPLEVAQAAERDRQRAAGEGRTTTFYGLRIDSNRVSFVIDTSGSMSQPAGGDRTTSNPGASTRLDVAIVQLSNALRSMLDGSHVNVIAFSSAAQAFEGSLVPLTDRSRQRLLRRVERLRPDGGTAIYEALLLALSDPDVDTIFLLTDGEPTVGRIRDPDAIRAAIRARNQERMVRIHGVAVGISSELLEGLAADSGGQYREVR